MLLKLAKQNSLIVSMPFFPVLLRVPRSSPLSKTLPSKRPLQHQLQQPRALLKCHAHRRHRVQRSRQQAPLPPLPHHLRLPLRQRLRLWLWQWPPLFLHKLKVLLNSLRRKLPLSPLDGVITARRAPLRTCEKDMCQSSCCP